MPSGRFHRASSLYHDGTEAPEVHRLLDSTAQGHGPSHRNDPIHTIQGAFQALAIQGKLTPGSIRAIFRHHIDDEGMSAVLRASGAKGPARRYLQEELERRMMRRMRRIR